MQKASTALTGDLGVRVDELRKPRQHFGLGDESPLGYRGSIRSKGVYDRHAVLFPRHRAFRFPRTYKILVGSETGHWDPAVARRAHVRSPRRCFR
jgi:hypothetical protein